MLTLYAENGIVARTIQCSPYGVYGHRFAGLMGRQYISIDEAAEGMQLNPYKNLALGRKRVLLSFTYV